MHSLLSESFEEFRVDLNKEIHKRGKEINQEYLKKIADHFLSDDNYIEETMELLKKTIPNSVCCFSEIYDNILMWSHYSEKHKGFCLIFNLENDINYWEKLFPVEYHQEYPILDNIEELSDKALLRKSSAWSYEAEWRILNMRVGKNKVNKNVFAGIIFGCNIDLSKMREIIAVCDSLEIENFKYYKMEKHKKEYKLNIKDLLLTSSPM